MSPKRLDRNAPVVVSGGTQPAATTSSPSQHEFPQLNSDFPWDEFNSSWYHDHNYKMLRDDDRQIIEIMRDFFAALDLPGHASGIDVGTGTNLYPALTMLPFCDKITLYEYSASNISWLQHEILEAEYSSSWDAFWKILTEEQRYKSIHSPRETLATVVHIESASIFDLPESRWDIGTMFFAAESISSTLSEFHTALRSFIRSLHTGAPFAAAFMENSQGYSVGTQRFPAVAITPGDVEDCLAGDTKDLQVHRIGLTDRPLRAGYGGMILATGRAVL
jgi:hypothetical protein